MNGPDSARIRYVANKYGATRSNLDAAAASIYVWQVQNTTRFDRYYAAMVKAGAISKTIQRRVSQIAAEAKNHGPYRLSMTMGAGYVGQSISGTVTVRAANGKAIRGLAIRLSASGSGALTRGSGTSDARGQVRFTTRVTKPGAVRVDARLVTPSTGVWITRPSAGRQRLVLHGRSTMTAKASVSSQRAIGGPTVRSACDTNCKGSAPVTVTMSNPCGSAVLREFIYSGGRQVPGGIVDVAPCRTASKTINLPDNALVTTRYCYLDSQRRCVSAPIANKGSLRVVCPPSVEYRFSGVCPCDGTKTMTYGVRAPANSVRSFSVTQVRSGPSGRQVNTATLKNGVWQDLPSVTLRAGDKVQLSLTVLGKTSLLDSATQES
ncbi:MAG: Ig-like domain-containing protein [Actinomycetes bacterium]